MEILDVDTVNIKKDTDVLIKRPRRKSRRMPLPATVRVRVGQTLIFRRRRSPGQQEGGISRCVHRFA